MPEMAALVTAIGGLVVSVGALIVSVGVFYLVVRLGTALENLSRQDEE